MLILTATSQVVLSQDRILTVTQSSVAVKLYSFNARERNNKIYLQWIIADNENADRIEVEKSMDGKNFTTAALVFCSETIGKETNKFYEAAPRGLAIYRLKIIEKNAKVSYSQILLLKAGK